jgi:hypothetical protein
MSVCGHQACYVQQTTHTTRDTHPMRSLRRALLALCAQAVVRLSREHNRVVDQLHALSAIMLSRSADCARESHSRARVGLELRTEQLAAVLRSEGEQLGALEDEVRRLGQSRGGPEVVERVCAVSTMLRNEARPVRVALERAIRSIEACCVQSEELVLTTLQSLAALQQQSSS